MLSELRELEGESEIDELEGVHGTGLVQVVSVKDGLGLLGGGAVDVEAWEEDFGLLEGEVTLVFLVSGAEQVEGEADEQEGGHERVVLEGAGVSGVGHRLESPHGARSQLLVAHGGQEGSYFGRSDATLVRLAVEERNSVHDEVVEPQEHAEGDHSLLVDQCLGVRQNLGREAGELELCQYCGEVRGLKHANARKLCRHAGTVARTRRRKFAGHRVHANMAKLDAPPRSRSRKSREIRTTPQQVAKKKCHFK